MTTNLGWSYSEFGGGWPLLNPEAPLSAGVVIRPKRAAISLRQIGAVGFVAPSILLGCFVDVGQRRAVRLPQEAIYFC